MAIKIKFDATHNVCPPTFVLATRSGRKLGSIPAEGLVFMDGMNTYSELSFYVNREINGEEYFLWEHLKDFKLMWCREWDIWYELSVELDESNETVKNVSAKSLGESELSQVNLYGIEINTENDILRDDYFPTVLFDEKDPNTSLLNRIMEKTPHYKISHVDLSIANIQRTFTFDNISLYDAFQEIAQEINCIFIIDSGSDKDGNIARSISVYDLESYCLECHHREEFLVSCPKCGSTNFLTGYGEDTGIFVSTENLADNITYSTDVGSVKNCFKLVAGDDLMTATLINCNPNGSGYLWYISDEIKEDMSEDLVLKLADYDVKYDYYQKEHEVSVRSDLLQGYNQLIDKYFTYSDKLEKISSSIIGYPNLMNAYYNTIDFALFLYSELMPNAELPKTNAAQEASKLSTNNLSPVAVSDITKCSESTASNAVLAMAKIIVDSRYQVKIKDGYFDDSNPTSVSWTGSFLITNYSNDEDSIVTPEIYVLIDDNYERYVKQKLEKALNKSVAETSADIVKIFELEDNFFIAEIKKYCLARLVSFHDACQACLDILIEQGVANKDNYEDQTPNLYEELYLPYYNKLSYLKDEINLREHEITVVTGKYDNDGNLIEDGLQPELETVRDEIQSILDFEKFLGETLWLEFVAYRREDTYQNDNYISDGLNNAELFNNALEFIDVAKKEIFKSSTLQHSITSTLKNLLAMKEFSPIVDCFEVGNWIRVRVDKNIYRLRLLSYEINFDDLNYISVTFSDVKSVTNGISDAESILNQASSIASSYGSISRQATQGKKGNDQLNNWVSEGLALTKLKIVDSAENQNITFDSHGLLCKEYLPITETYDDKQLKLINRGIYLTDDNWLTSRVGIGDFTFYNPETEKMEEAYGVIADTLVGNLILGEKVGVYNKENSITLGENGIVITSDGTMENGLSNTMSFTIQKKTFDQEGNVVIVPVMYIDENGDVVLNGTIRINTSTTTDDGDVIESTETLNEAISPDRLDSALEEHIAQVGQYMQFDENGLKIGATSSTFSTIIDNTGTWFMEGEAVVSYINNTQLHTVDAVIDSTLTIGKFIISPREDGGTSITWVE